MYHIITRFCGTPGPAIPVPIVIPCIMFVFLSWSRSLKKVPIQSLRYRGWFCYRYFTPLVTVEGYCFISFTNYAIMNFLYNILCYFRRTCLIAHLYNFIVLLLKLYEQFTFFRVMAAWFFNIHMFPCTHSITGARSMPMIGRQVEHGIYIFRFLDTADIIFKSWLIIQNF